MHTLIRQEIARARQAELHAAAEPTRRWVRPSIAFRLPLRRHAP